jgi:hypothetical protein
MGSTMNNSTTQTSGLTKQDFYDATRSALDDAGHDQVSPHPGGLLSDQTGAFSDRGHVDDVQAQADAVALRAASASAGLQAKIADAAKLDWVPQQLGTVETVTLGSMSLAGITHEVIIDFRPFAAIIAIIRAMIMFGFSVMFAFLVVRTLRAYM